MGHTQLAVSAGAEPASAAGRQETDRAALKSYIAGMYRVRGYMHPVDAFCYAAILQHQNARALGGSLAEIGVFYGRSFFLMAKSLRPGEKAVAADLFDRGPREQGEAQQLRDFRQTARELGITLDPACVFAGPSETLTPGRILDAAGRIRFFSIDGGHLLHHVASDSALADAVLADHGVMAFDDFGNPEWPEVSLGVFDFLRAHDGAYQAFAITKAKLYVCRQEFHREYSAMIRGTDWLAGFARKDAELFGVPLPWVHHGIKERIVFEGLHRIGLGRVALRIGGHAPGRA